jgi:hypothetical protein
MNHILFTKEQVEEAIWVAFAFVEKRRCYQAEAVEIAVNDAEEKLIAHMSLIEEGTLPVNEQYRQLSWLDCLPVQ